MALTTVQVIDNLPLCDTCPEANQRGPGENFCIDLICPNKNKYYCENCQL